MQFFNYDDDKIVRMALENLAVIAPGDPIDANDMASCRDRLAQMLDEAFLIECLTPRLAPMFGKDQFPMPPDHPLDQRLRMRAADYAIANIESPDPVIEAARKYLAFLRG